MRRLLLPSWVKWSLAIAGIGSLLAYWEFSWIAERHAFLESQRAWWWKSQFRDQPYRPARNDRRAEPIGLQSIHWIFGEKSVHDIGVLTRSAIGSPAWKREAAEVERLFPEARKFWYVETGDSATADESHAIAE